MYDFGPYASFGESERFYVQARRRRKWSSGGARGLQGYAAFLAGEESALLPANVVGAEVANVIRVTVQLKDAAGTNLAFTAGCNAWLSDTAGGAVTGTVPGALAISTAGIIVTSPVAS